MKVEIGIGKFEAEVTVREYSIMVRTIKDHGNNILTYFTVPRYLRAPKGWFIS